MDKEYAEYLLEKTKQNYNLIADDFSSKREIIWGEFNFLKDEVFVGEKILDLGCGNGRFIELFNNRNIEYFGADNSEKLIEIAKKKYPQGKFQIVDGLILPFPDNFFDRVISIAVLHHIPSEKFRLQFLNEIKRVLKPKGLLTLTVWDLLQRKTSWKSLFKYTFLKLAGKSKMDFGDILVPWKNHQGIIKAERYFHCFTKKEIKRITEKIGFEIKEIKLLKRSAGHYNILLTAQKPS